MSQWRVAIGQKQYGPYSLEKLRDIYQEGRVPAEAQVWHPERQQWILAEDVAELNDTQTDDPGEIILVDDGPSKSVALASASQQSIARPNDSIGDYLAFRRMITPIIIQVLFWIFAILACIGGIVMMVGGILAKDVTAFLWASSRCCSVRLRCEFTANC